MKVSVLMPVYNTERYLALAIDSIISQTFTDWELIIVNDGSTDKSEEIVLSYTDTRIRYIRNAENKGIIYTRNMMIEMALGTYIAFLDSDDISDASRLEYQVKFLDNHPEYALCGTWGVMIDDNGQQIGKINMPSSDEEIRCSLLFVNTFIQSSIMIRREVLISHPYDKAYPVAEDYELWCRLSHLYKLKNIPIQLTQYRWHGNNISKSKKELMASLVNSIYKKELSYLGINVTEHQIELHAAIKDKEVVKIPANLYFEELRTWLKQIAQEGSKNKIYNKNTLRATIVFRWIFACKEWKMWKKCIPFPIRLNMKEYRILLKMLSQRIIK